MANVNRRFLMKELAIFVVWLLSLTFLIYGCVLAIDGISYDIKLLEPVSSTEAIDFEAYEIDLSSLSADESAIQNNENVNANNQQRLESYRQELLHKRKASLCLLIGVSVYGLIACVLFFAIKSRGNAKSLLYVLLIILNVVFVYHFPF